METKQIAQIILVVSAVLFLLGMALMGLGYSTAGKDTQWSGYNATYLQNGTVGSKVVVISPYPQPYYFAVQAHSDWNTFYIGLVSALAGIIGTFLMMLLVNVERQIKEATQPPNQT